MEEADVSEHLLRSVRYMQVQVLEEYNRVVGHYRHDHGHRHYLIHWSAGGRCAWRSSSWAAAQRRWRAEVWTWRSCVLAKAPTANQKLSVGLAPGKASIQEKAACGAVWPHPCLPAAPRSLLPGSPGLCYCGLSQSTNADVVPFSPLVPQLLFPLTFALTGCLVLSSGSSLCLLVSPTSLLWLARWLIPSFFFFHSLSLSLSLSLSPPNPPPTNS